MSLDKANIARFCSKALELAKSKQLEQAHQELACGPKIFRNDFYLLCIGSDISRATRSHSSSIESASLLIKTHPEQWDDYGRAAGNLHALKRFHEGWDVIEKGLEKFPGRFLLVMHCIKDSKGIRQSLQLTLLR